MIYITKSDIQLKNRKIMQKMKMYRIAGMALLMVVIFTSCMENQDPQFDILGDVYVTKKMINDEIQYAPAYFLYANLGMTSAKVTLPNAGGTVNLDGTAGGLTYSKEPTDADFSTNMPVEGSYLFEAVNSKNEILQVSDELQLDDLAIPEFDSIEFISSSTLQVSWNAVSGADGYFIRIVDNNGNDVYLSYSIDNSVTEYTILESDGTGKWEQPASSGQTYTIQINAFSYHSGAVQNNNVYNIEEVAIGQSQVTWE
jgi:hypothetical protein